MPGDEGETRRAAIREWRMSRSRRAVILDDDPTGSQTVHDVEVVLSLDPSDIADALRETGAVFVLTNTRGLPADDAVALTRSVVVAAVTADAGVDIVSRSDSTLRGHVLDEVRAIQETLAQPADGVVLAPAFFEAGRFTSGGTHYATIAGRAVPVGETEFARDATFGYRSSDLADFLVERAGGEIRRDQVVGIGLDDIERGPEAVRDILLAAERGSWFVIDATGYEHYEIVVLGVQAAIDAGRSFIYRTGPSFVRALLGIEPRPPLDVDELRRIGGQVGHGLVVVGSHVSQTSRQVASARREGGWVEHVISVPRILAGEDAVIEDSVAAIRRELAEDDVLLYTSRELVTGADAADSLEISRRVSGVVAAVVAGSLPARPAWVVAKGGITSHEVAVRGLGIRRARVAGQLLPGIISVFVPVVAPPELAGVPYVVFAGNVGDDDTLAHVVSLLRSAQDRG